MISTTPRTLRNANYIVYTACAIGIAGLASVGLAMAMREDPPLKPTAETKPIPAKDPARSRASTPPAGRSRAASSKPEDQEQGPARLAEPAPPPVLPKQASSEAHTKPVAIPDDAAPGMPPQTAPGTVPPTETKPERRVQDHATGQPALTAAEQPSKLALVVQPPAVTYGPATAAQRAEIVAAIERADRAEMKAMRTLDLSSLKSTHAGKAYNLIRDAVANLKKQGFYVASEFAGATVESVKISSDGQKAQVRTTETWESSWYNSQTNVCKAHVHKRPVPQTVFLALGKQGWVISDVKHDNHGPLPFVACHN